MAWCGHGGPAPGSTGAREAYASAGFLTGAAWLRRGERLAWTGLVLVAVSLVVALVIGIIRLAEAPYGQDFAPNVD